MKGVCLRAVIRASPQVKSQILDKAILCVGDKYTEQNYGFPVEKIKDRRLGWARSFVVSANRPIYVH
jgi:hypothetical protein